MRRRRDEEKRRGGEEEKRRLCVCYCIAVYSCVLLWCCRQEIFLVKTTTITTMYTPHHNRFRPPDMPCSLLGEPGRGAGHRWSMAQPGFYGRAARAEKGCDGGRDACDRPRGVAGRGQRHGRRPGQSGGEGGAAIPHIDAGRAADAPRSVGDDGTSRRT